MNLWRLWRSTLIVVFAGLAVGSALWDLAHPAAISGWLQGERFYLYYRQQLIWYALGGVVGSVGLWGLAVVARLRLLAPYRPRFWQPADYSPLLEAAVREATAFVPLLAAPLILVRHVWHPLGMGVGSAFWTYALVPVLAWTLAHTLAPAFQALPLPKHLTATRAVWGGIVLYVLVFGGLSVARHLSFFSHALDLGTMSQAMWNTAHGRPFEYTPMLEAAMLETPPVSSRLTSGKLELIFLALAPLYRLWPNPILLLVVQTVALGLSAWPFYLTLVRWLEDARPALWLTLAYLAYLPLHYVNMFDFHPTALMPIFLTTAVYAAEQRRWRLYGVALVGALACRVDAAFVALGLGALLLVRRRRMGLLTLALGLFWLIFDFGVVVPLAEARYGPDPVGLIGQRFGQFGTTPAEIALNMARHPLQVAALLLDREKAQTLFDLFVPVGGLALLAPLWLAPAAPVALVNLLAESAWQGTVRAHYFAPVLPFVFLATGAALWQFDPEGARPERRRTLALYVLAAALLVAYFFSPFPPGRAFHLRAYMAWSPHHAAIKRVLAQVDPESALSGQSDLLPHLANRRFLYLFPNGLESADEVVLDLDVSAERAPLDYFAFFELVDALTDNPAFGLKAWDNGVVLLARGAPHDPARLRALRRAYDEAFYRVEWITHQTPTRMRAGELYMPRICFRNTGSQGWRSVDWYPVFLSYHWLTRDGTPVVWDGERTRLPYTVYPTWSICLRAPVVAPETPGLYRLQFDLVREHQYWFTQKGAKPLEVQVEVTP